MKHVYIYETRIYIYKYYNILRSMMIKYDNSI